MNVPEILHPFIETNYNSEELAALKSDGWGFPDKADTSTFVDDFLRRPALWVALSEEYGQPDMSDFTPEFRRALADWIALVAPHGVKMYREGLEEPSGDRFVDKENRRVGAMIFKYFPEAYGVIFD